MLTVIKSYEIEKEIQDKMKKRKYLSFPVYLQKLKVCIVNFSVITLQELDFLKIHTIT